ncbi:MAG: ATP-binding protein [Bacteroidetes bacterium]|nr:ATP-binding protein [Bacteroidota bacterium]
MIFREILNNTIKHAKASHISICVQIQKEIFLLTIADDGVGFDEEKIKKGHGLDNLRRRAEKLGGKINIMSSVGKGTTTELSFKIP